VGGKGKKIFNILKKKLKSQCSPSDKTFWNGQSRCEQLAVLAPSAIGYLQVFRKEELKADD
jgi:hypothetical protein